MKFLSGIHLIKLFLYSDYWYLY